MILDDDEKRKDSLFYTVVVAKEQTFYFKKVVYDASSTALDRITPNMKRVWGECDAGGEHYTSLHGIKSCISNPSL